MDIKTLVNSLHPLERRILPYLTKQISVKELEQKSGLSEVEVMRALQWLSNKEIIKIEKQEKELIELDENGKRYQKNGLPEKVFLKAIEKAALTQEELLKKGLNEQEIAVSIGTLKKKMAIEILESKKIKITDYGREILTKRSFEEELLDLLAKSPVDPKYLTPEQTFAFTELSKRRSIVKKTSLRTIIAIPSEICRQLLSQKIENKEIIDAVTPEMLKSGSWKGKEFRRYDVKINVPKITGAKRHFVLDVADYAKRVWLEFGFEEMNGAYTQTSFWNFDALFTAQDHPVREMQDTFFIKDPEKGILPDKKIVERVKNAHENGGTTGSTGWQYKWNPEEAKKKCAEDTHNSTKCKNISIIAIKRPAKEILCSRQEF